MSRLGKLPIKLPEGVKAKKEDGFIIVSGPKGELKEKTHTLVNINVTDKDIQVSVEDKTSKKQKAFWGLYWSLINNMIIGVTEGYEKKLEINGVGYRASCSGQKLNLIVGYSHPVDFILPEGIIGKVEGNVISVSGISKQLVGETAAKIRKVRKPEPYKGKGIKYMEEVIRRKAGKTAVKA